DGTAGGVVDDGEEMRVDRARLELDVGGKIAEARERTVEQIGPDALALRVAVRALIERLGVLLGVERGERDPSALEREPLRAFGVMGLDEGADGLLGGNVVIFCLHGSSEPPVHSSNNGVTFRTSNPILADAVCKSWSTVSNCTSFALSERIAASVRPRRMNSGNFAALLPSTCPSAAVSMNRLNVDMISDRIGSEIWRSRFEASVRICAVQTILGALESMVFKRSK